MMKTVIRTLTYQALIVSVMLAGIFLADPLTNSRRLEAAQIFCTHVFSPVDRDVMNEVVKAIGKKRFYIISETNGKDLSKIKIDNILTTNEEWVIIYYTYDGFDQPSFSTRVIWKTWEWYLLHEGTKVH